MIGTKGSPDAASLDSTLSTMAWPLDWGAAGGDSARPGRDGVLAVRCGRSCRRFVGCGAAYCAVCGCGSAVRGDGCRFGAELRALVGLVYGAGGGLRAAAEAEDHAGQDGEGAEEPKRGDGAGALVPERRELA